MAQHFLQLSTPNWNYTFQLPTHILGPLTTNRKRTARNLGVIIDSDLSFEPRTYHISTGLLLNSTAQKSKRDKSKHFGFEYFLLLCLWHTPITVVVHDYVIITGTASLVTPAVTQNTADGGCPSTCIQWNSGVTVTPSYLASTKSLSFVSNLSRMKQLSFLLVFTDNITSLLS